MGIGARDRPTADHKTEATMSTLVSRNVRINGRRTSVKLEPAMWEALAEICAREGIGIGQLCTGVEAVSKGVEWPVSM